MVSQYLHSFRTAPLDELVTVRNALDKCEGELVALSKAEDGFDIKVSQESLHQLRKSPELPFCFRLLAGGHLLTIESAPFQRWTSSELCSVLLRAFFVLLWFSTHVQ